MDKPRMESCARGGDHRQESQADEAGLDADLLFEMPLANEEGILPPLSSVAMAYVLEIQAACDRANMPHHGRADFVRSVIRLVGDCRFGNRRGITTLISKADLDFQNASGSYRREVQRIRPAVFSNLSRKLGRMFVSDE
jgi:hypothetical protein